MISWDVRKGLFNVRVSGGIYISHCNTVFSAQILGTVLISQHSTKRLLSKLIVVSSETGKGFAKYSVRAGIHITLQHNIQCTNSGHGFI